MTQKYAPPARMLGDVTVVESENSQARAGLRERKKVQTRARLIEVALELCDSQGFDATTVEQISDAADISPRTFNRYFATKEDVILAPVDDMVTAVVNALDTAPHTGNEFAALLHAHTSVMRGECPALTTVDLCRFEVMNRIVQSSPTVSGRSAEVGETKFRRISEKVAERMSTVPDDIQVRVVVSVWMSLMHVAMDQACGVGAIPGPDDVAARVDSLNDTYEVFRKAVTNV